MKKYMALLLLVLMLCSACIQGPAKPLPQNESSGSANDPPSSTAQQHDINFDTSFIEGFDGKVGLYAKNLKTLQTISFHADDIFPTASTHKLVVALAVYKYLYPNAPKETQSEYDELIRKMMVISDNPSFYTLLDEIEMEKPDVLTQVLKDLNLTRTRIHSDDAFKKYGYHSVTTSYEMAIVFETIYNKAYLGPQVSDILISELSKTIFKEELPRYMPGNRVLHKAGQLPDGILNDVGIIDDGSNQILISIFTKTNQTPEYASDFIANLSAKSHDILKAK